MLQRKDEMQRYFSGTVSAGVQSLQAAANDIATYEWNKPMQRSVTRSSAVASDDCCPMMMMLDGHIKSQTMQGL